jgi:putative ABC transport system substrate-binding protein
MLEDPTMRLSTIGVMFTLALAICVAPLAAEAQPAKVPRIGVLLALPTPELFQAVLREGLRELGYVEGQNIRVDSRYVAAGETDRLNDLAAELVRLPVDLIVALPTPAAQAAQHATTTIPIVMSAGNPLETGLVASLARPGGNVTGISGITAELGGKCLELLRELLPAATHVAVLVHATDPFARPFLEHIESTAQGVGVSIQRLVVRGDEEFEGAFTAMMTERAGAVIVQPLLATRRVADLALEHHLPVISPSVPFAEAGGLITYAADRANIWRRTAY